MAFPKKTPDEIKLITFDFSTEAAEGSVLSNPTVICEAVVAGTGGAVGDLDITDIEVVIGQKVTCLVGDGVDGCQYRLRCCVDADNGEHHEIEKVLPVADLAALVK